MFKYLIEGLHSFPFSARVSCREVADHYVYITMRAVEAKDAARPGMVMDHVISWNLLMRASVTQRAMPSLPSDPSDQK